MRNKSLQLIIVFSCMMLMGAEKPELAPRPERGFVDAAHEAIYVKYETENKRIHSVLVSDRVLIDTAFAITLDDLFRRITLSQNAGRVRDLMKIAAGWVDVEGKTDIEGEIPEELSTVVDGYRAALQNFDLSHAELRREQLDRLIRDVDAHATSFEAQPDGLETMRLLRKEARSLMPRRGTAAKWGELELTSFDWAYGDKRFVRMQVKGDELLTLGRLRGRFAGGGESVWIGPWDEGTVFGLEARSMQRDVQATAYALRHPRLNLSDWRVHTKQINSGDSKVKLLHKSRGFCYLAGIWGHWAGLATAEVSVDPKDGFYYLSMRNETTASGTRAVIVEYPEGTSAPDFEFTTAQWIRGEPARELIDAKDGICLLSGLSGAIAGRGEEINLIVGTNGKWRLGGRSKQPGTGAKVLVIRFTKSRSRE